jgi:hypothetical protein
VGELLAAVVGLGRVGQDLDDQDRVCRSVTIDGRSFERATHHDDVRVGAEICRFDPDPQIRPVGLAWATAQSHGQLGEHDRLQRRMLGWATRHRKDLTAQVLMLGVAHLLGGEVGGVGHVLRLGHFLHRGP